MTMAFKEFTRIINWYRRLHSARIKNRHKKLRSNTTYVRQLI